MKSKPVHYGRRYDVTAWIPTKPLTDLAHERTEGLVGYFLSCAHQAPLRWQAEVATLARSCYLQGINDMLDAARDAAQRQAEAGETVPVMPPDLSAEIA